MVKKASEIRVGPAGWSYADWGGLVYPKPKPRGFDPLAYIAEFFDTIEINSTFYRPAAKHVAESWARRVGTLDFVERFKFTAKLWKRFTHERSEAFTRADVATVREGFDPLLDAGRLGAVLLQFPWSFRRTDENRQWLDDVARAFRHYPLVLEVRHASWNVPEFYEELVDRSIGFVNIDQPLFKNSIKPSATVTSLVGYVRIHGRNYREWFRKDAGVEARYDYLYTPSELRPWAERADELSADTRETYVVTNNHYKGKAAVNALMLQSMLTGEKVDAPPELIEAYPDVLKRYARPAETAAELATVG